MRRTRQTTKSSVKPKYKESSDDEPVDTSTVSSRKKTQVKYNSKITEEPISTTINTSESENSSDDFVKDTPKLKSIKKSKEKGGSSSGSEEEYDLSENSDSDLSESERPKPSRQPNRKSKLKGTLVAVESKQGNRSSIFRKLNARKRNGSSNEKEIMDMASSVSKNKDGTESSGSSSDEFVRVRPSESVDITSKYFEKKEEPVDDFAAVESKIFMDVTSTLSDSESEVEYTEVNWGSLSGTSSSLPISVTNTSAVQKVENVSDQKTSTRSKKRGKAKRKGDVKDESKTLDVLQLLKIGEGVCFETESVDKYVPSDEDTDLEEVSLDEEEGMVEDKPHTIPKEGVQITLEVPELHQRRKKKDFDMEAYLLRRLNNRKRSIQILIHKVHILAWIYHGQFVNAILNSEELMGLSLSLIPSQHCYPPKHADLAYMEKILKWFNKTVSLKETIIATYPPNLLQSLLAQFNTKIADSKRDLVFMFICILRSLGIKARLVLSLQPAPLKLASHDLCTSLVKKPPDTSTNQKVVKKEPDDHAEPGPSKTIAEDKKVESKSKYFDKQSEDKTQKKKSKYFNDTSEKSQSSSKDTKRKASAKTANVQKSKRSKSLKTNDEHSTENAPSRSKPEPVKNNNRATKRIDKKDQPKETNSSGTKEGARKKTLLRRQVKSQKPVAAPPQSDDSDFEPQQKRRRSKVTPVKKVNNKKTNKKLDTSKSTPSKKSSTTKIKSETAASDSDFQPEAQSSSDTDSPAGSDSDIQFVPQVVKLPTKKWDGKIDRRVLSSDSEDASIAKKATKKRRLSKDKEEQKSEKKKIGIDVWTEVFLEAEEKWFCVDVPRQKVHCHTELLAKATQPVLYVVAFNNDATIKDVTRRYVVNWTTIKQRVDESWWEKAISPFLGKRTALDLEEDEELSNRMINHPLPTVIGEYKNHPLYALKRHLLKFEAIYPPEAPTLGFVRGEAVYSRDCVHGLHSREVWVKEAKVVKPGEQPYKIVKARPKYDKPSGTMITDLPLEVFGLWQVGEYVPPTAQDGKVPRNEYGNVELFKPCMLPKGTVHLPIPGLSRVAKKLGIDCAPAMIGFDYHSGGSHPTYDGYVVCEEHKDIILDAWRQDVEESEKRAEAKLEKRVYDNWKRLIKGLLIRERLKQRYSFGEAQPSTSRAKPSSKTSAKKSTAKKGN